jgi:DNA polymerase-3 subunit delta
MARSADHSKTGYKELKAELRRGTFRNLYVLYGEETFLIDKLCQSLREMLIAPGAEVLDAVTLSGSAAAKISPDRLLAEIQTPPFLSRCRLVMVRGSGLFAAADRAADETGEGTADSEPAEQEQRNSKGQKQEWIRILSTVPESACLVFVEGKVDRRQKALLQAVEERGVLAEIGPEQPALLRQWVVAEARQRGYTIDPLAAESLVDRCGNSMQMLWQEMCKLFLYLEYTKSQQIDRNLIDLLSLPDSKEISSI